LIKDTRPKPISKCPPIIQLLLKRGMDGDPAKRPSIKLIVEIMTQINLLINKQPPKPLVTGPELFNADEEIRLANNYKNGRIIEFKAKRTKRNNFSVGSETSMGTVDSMDSNATSQSDTYFKTPIVPPPFNLDARQSNTEKNNNAFEHLNHNLDDITQLEDSNQVKFQNITIFDEKTEKKSQINNRSDSKKSGHLHRSNSQGFVKINPSSSSASKGIYSFDLF
jgi:hypothetical protein